MKAPITVRKCLNTGNVVGGNDAGGIVGTAYNNASVTGLPESCDIALC